MTIAGLVQHVARAAKNRAGVQGSMSSIIARIKYLYHAKWIPPPDVDNALDELQSSSGWMAPTTSTQTGSQDGVYESIVSSRAPTPPPFETYLTEDQSSTRNPAYTHPPEYSDTATTPTVTITATDDGSDSEDSFEAEIVAAAKGCAKLNANYNEHHPYLEIGDHQPTWPTPPPTPFGGTDLKPPTLNYCGSSPGEDWKYNDTMTSRNSITIVT